MDIPIVQLLIEGIKFAGQVIPSLFKKSESPPLPATPQVIVQPNVEVNVNNNDIEPASVQGRKKTRKMPIVEAPAIEIIPASENVPQIFPDSETELLTAVVKETKTIVSNTYMTETNETRAYITDNRTFVSDNRSYIQNNLTIVHQVDKKFFVSVIDRATDNLSKAISASSEIILVEMRKKEVREVIREIQAHITTLQNLTTYNTLDPQIAFQLMTNILNPLQVRIEYARLTLTEPEDKVIWNLCYLSGTTALLAGYAFLGQEIPQLRKDLEIKMQEIQVELLDQVARKMLINKKATIPWEKIPLLLKPEGAEELSQLFMSVFKPYEHKSTSKVLTKVSNSKRAIKRSIKKRR